MTKDLRNVRIALVGPLPPPSGGMANQTLQLKNLLETANANVTLVQVNSAYRPRAIANLKGIRALFRLYFYVRECWNSLAKVDLVHVMANSGWSWHLFAAPAIWIAYFRSCPIVLNYRGGEAEKFFKQSWIWVKPSVSKANIVIVPSPFLQRVFDMHAVKASVVPNILDLERFQMESKERPPGRALKIVVTRNLEKIYDVETVIRAFKLISLNFENASLSIAGSGPEEAALKGLCNELELEHRVIFCGRIENREVAELYREADLMLNASRVDNSPNALIEAMASGVPVVSTDAGGIPDLITHGETGLLVPVGDVQQLAGAAIKILEDQPLRDSLIKNGQSAVRKFDKSLVLVRLVREYLGLLENPPAISNSWKNIS